MSGKASACVAVVTASGRSLPALGVSRDAVQRHASNHLGPAQRAAILVARRPGETVDVDKLKADEGEGLLSHVLASRARLQQLAELALDAADIRAAVSVENGINANLTLAARLLGQLISVSEHRSTSILVSSDYLALRAELLAALRPHPAAMRDVSAALHRLEAEAAESIGAAAGSRTPTPRLIEHGTPLGAAFSGAVRITAPETLPPLPPPPPLPRPPC
jgi:hypothetical protein